MGGTISLQRQDMFSTQTLEKGEILNYRFRQEKLFEDVSDEFSRFFITRWELEPFLQVQPISQKVLKKEKHTEANPYRSEEIETIQIAKQWHRLHLKEILKKYEGKYIAVILNPVKGIDNSLKEAIVSSAKDFHQLASKVYKKYGHITIYMPFISKEPVTRKFQIPTPLWIKRK